MAAAVFRRRLNHQAQINRLFRDQIIPLKIFDDVELYAKFRFWRVHILDELQEAIEHPLTRLQANSVALCETS